MTTTTTSETHPAEAGTDTAPNRSLRTMTQLTEMMTRDDLDWDARLTRLQGWRGSDAEAADDAKWAQRLAALGCTTGALVGGVLQSPLILALFAATAVVGMFAPNHPFETIYNRTTRRTGAPALPANRAAKRLGCAMGTIMLGGSAILLLAGATTVGTVVAIAFGLTALFVATTGICVPSVMFTLIWGAQKGTAPTLGQAFQA